MYFLALSFVMGFVLVSNKTSLRKHQFGSRHLDNATKVKDKMTDVFITKIKIKLELWNIRITRALFFR